MQSSNQIHQSILFTIRYYDAFSHPLTNFEIWVYAYGKPLELHEVVYALDEMVACGTIERFNNFYFMPGRQELVKTRAQRYEISQKLWEKAVKATRLLSYLPFIEGVFVNNSLAFFNCDRESDIDFTIITTPGRIWTARALSGVLLQVMGLRRHGKNIAGEVCLSLYISREAMDMSSIKPEKYPFFLAYWIGQNSPLLSTKGCFEGFHQENSWIKEFLPNIVPHETNYYTRFEKAWAARYIRSILGFILKPQLIENIARLIQKAKITRSQKKRGNPPSVLFNDSMLKFHTDDWKRVRDIAWEQYLPPVA
ncbi:MAG: hypothetical protein WC045_02480 [Patescibacteria group bacterium]